MKGLLVLCVAVLAVDAVLTAGISKKDVPDKTTADEDVYGDLNEENGDVQKDQTDYYDEKPEDTEGAEEVPYENGGSNEINVQMTSKPETFVQEIGSIVLLPCLSSSKSKEQPVRVWKKDSQFIYQGNINIQNAPNYRLLANGTLEVLLNSTEDFGTYTCQLAISETDQPSVVHTVLQKTSPSITALFTKDNKEVYSLNDELVLTCQASGYPKPKISWHKNNERLGTEGETLTIDNVKVKHAGQYRCLADNGVGRPAHKYIEVFVNHEPIVSIEKYIVNSDHEKDAELVCEVKAYPSPAVYWQRDGNNIVSKPPKITLQREKNNERNVLIIKNIEENDFGTYSCVAQNALGKQGKNISLVKTPVVRKMERSQTNESLKDIILQWKVESKQPISKHELQYRKKGESSWKTISPEVGNGDNDVYLIKHTLKNLEPGIYETRARSKNSHGWSNYSEIIPFEGARAKHHHPKPTKGNKKDQRTQESSTHDTPAPHSRSEELTPVGESTSSSSILSASIVLTSLSFLLLAVQHTRR